MKDASDISLVSGLLEFSNFDLRLKLGSHNLVYICSKK